MRVIRASAEHLPALTELFHQYRAFYGRPREDPAAGEFLAERMRRGESVALLALGDDGAAMGFAQLYPTFSSIRLAPAWILNDLFTAPAHRRRGVARALLDAVRALAGESGAAVVELATSHDNHSARALYEEEGYREDREFVHYYLETPRP